MIERSRILVLGGYGGFGGRISRRLAEAGHSVIVADRNLQAAEAFSAGYPNMQPVCLDRTAGLEEPLAALHPNILIDASGPFQSADLSVPRACIAAGVHYIDIADGRAFVIGISVFDDAARKAGIVVISGASSVPALSGAVVRELLQEVEQVDAVQIAISASNKAAAGRSVAAAILSYVGRPLRLWRGGRWQSAWRWQELEELTFNVTGPLIAAALLAGCSSGPPVGTETIVYETSCGFCFGTKQFAFKLHPDGRGRLGQSLHSSTGR